MCATFDTKFNQFFIVTKFKYNFFSHELVLFGLFCVSFVLFFSHFSSQLVLICQFMQCTFHSCQFQTAQHTLALSNHGVSFFFFSFLLSFFLQRAHSIYLPLFSQYYSFFPSFCLNETKETSTQAHMPSV